MSNFITAGILALAVGSMGYTVAFAKIFEPVRNFVESKADESKFWDWLFFLLGCPYCIGHWISFVLVTIYRPWLVNVWLPIDFLVTSVAIVNVAMLSVIWIRLALKSRL